MPAVEITYAIVSPALNRPFRKFVAVAADEMAQALLLCPDAGFLASPGRGACSFTDFAMAGGRITGTMHCAERGGTTTTRMTGDYAGDGYRLGMTIETPMPDGALKRASVPVPSTAPDVPGNPASVVTTPAGVIFRMALLPLSAT